MKGWIQYILWMLAVSVWSVGCFIVPDFIDNPIDGFRGACMLLAYISTCGIGSFLLLYIIGINKYVCSAILPLWAILGAGLSFYRAGYHTTLTPMLIDATLHTNAEEAIGVISWLMIAWVVLNLLIACLFILWRWSKVQIQYPLIHCVVALILCLSYLNANGRLYNSLCQRFPYNLYYNIKEYISFQHSINNKRSIPDYSIIKQTDSLTIVLIIGESVRADHLQLNDYPRETTPRLLLRKNIVTFPHIYSEQTHTLACMPYILTRADSINSECQYTESSFITIFRQEGFKTAWISNQNLGNTFAHFPSEADTIVFANSGKTDYVFTPWLDGELVPIMHTVFQPAPSKALYVLHSIGSHWYYNSHVPADMYYYQPITSNRVIKLNTIEQIVNSYDNSIRYMDLFIDSVINQVENQEALVIYMSDHGEALGEDGAFLHANDIEAVKNPACVIWYSNKYAASNPDKIKALIANKDKRYRNDFVFYSILSAAGIEAAGNSSAVNIFQ